MDLMDYEAAVVTAKKVGASFLKVSYCHIETEMDTSTKKDTMSMSENHVRVLGISKTYDISKGSFGCLLTSV